MAYTDLDTIHNPTAGTRPPASWGAAVNDNFDFVYDEVLAKIATFSTFTPSWTQSTTISKTVSYAKYRKVGKAVTGSVVLAATGAGTAANALVVGAPVTAASGIGVGAGSGYLLDAGTGLRYPFVVILASTTTFSFIPADQALGGLLGATGGSFTAAIASGDTLVFTFDYESAS